MAKNRGFSRQNEGFLSFFAQFLESRIPRSGSDFDGLEPGD
jgi:hypothetical protein